MITPRGKRLQLSHLRDLRSALPDAPCIVLHSACAEPPRLAQQLSEAAEVFRGATVYGLMPMGEAPYAGVEATEHLSVQALFPGKGLREPINSGRASFRRCTLSEIPALFVSGEIRADLLLLQVSAPDENGRMSLGVSVDYMRAVLAQDPIVVAEVNPQMPFTCGDTALLPEEVDFVINANRGPQVVCPADTDDIDLTIAGHIAGLISSGAVLQTGIGALPDLVFTELGHLYDLGIHSGVISDGVRPLIERGVVTNATKKVLPGKTVTTMAAGTRSFYDFLDRNPLVEFHPCSFTHALDVLAAIDGLVAINSVLQVDINGSANAEQVGDRVISTPGGLPDFARGASAAKGGMSVIALRAATKGDAVSNIVTAFGRGVPRTVGAQDIDYVVTEYGVARLRNKSPAQRALELSAVAHPDFRAALRRGETFNRTKEHS
ncbi:acetyl-CoA hydrolase/transferase family protein [Thauera chlorobenzoica]|uniref:acetyl-CoA hydrolase/transferase family protein n=1 Tax=Thauera chlorobenzoica TaxID=96773 RepID=UPI00089FC0CE|nr:acetyl-CoA hydrolase/transferase C-terminal domain-containing protein [Thauera chlorobenzoica]SEG27233.1 4-hydroxybutyrate CoA-transferase [Thauera chlorobenzoica]